MHKILTFILLVTALTVSAQQPVFISDSLDNYIEREMKRWNLPGMAIAVVKDGEPVIVKGYGVTDIHSRQKVDQNTLFMIASNSKLFTGTSLALLADQGRLTLEDKVTDHLPYFKMFDASLTGMVTIEDILSHRLGFETFQGDFYNWGNNASREEIIKHISKVPPVYDFRDTWGYCNAGFVTAGEIIHTVTDTTWEDYVQHHFFDPLDMQHTSAAYEKIKADKNAAKPYTIFRNKLVDLEYDNLNNIAPCGGINSSVEDLSHWMIMLADNGKYKGNQIIPEQVIADTRMPRSIVGDGHSRLFPSQHFDLYGLGVGMNDLFGKEMYWHTGGADGFVTSVCILPEEKLGIAVLTNSDANYLFIAAMYQIIEAYMQQPYRNISELFYGFMENNNTAENSEIDAWYTTAAAHPKPALALKEYAGSYYNDVYGKMEIEIKNDALVATFEHHPQLHGNLEALGGNNFVCTYDPVTWGVKEIPFTVENGKVKSVTITVNDFIDFMPYTFVKK